MDFGGGRIRIKNFISSFGLFIFFELSRNYVCICSLANSQRKQQGRCEQSHPQGAGAHSYHRGDENKGMRSVCQTEQLTLRTF